ncbi:ABC transporter ATP-binding protein (plasmid) [Ensifer adhaerens]|uniref:ABC transporter ATP-binding protein n=1 Tax=Ensifer adhaerens TaxID=106592 RepID=UPI001CBB658F|nr:ABC transporter ATP-binding protein [Ensifer adhaerens]MBZ7927389.1 ABC transporter ATP-binding protein [Ensifer adhaerens]UAX97822.1 ABC transporter ATP-binding protein [Ensifer adhaerens]UAY05201.1 ABC transporter ATP-binding protein [Ensifer adhaerens]UAY12579.1 ABC transporter ATP-binding protein [Ensifer adhaerens]
MSKLPFLRIDNIRKRFGSIVASDGVSLEITEGEIHSLLGENGAGKSVLMSMICGMVRPDEGEIVYKGQSVRFNSPREAIRQRIGMVHQHFMLVPNLTVAENYILGQGSALGVINDMNKVHETIRALSDRYALDVRPEARIEDLSVGEQQRVEILKALFHGVDLLILDEPTAVLTPQETDRLLCLMGDLVKDGKTVVFISHKLDEVMRVSNRISVMRDGRVVHTIDARETNARDLARMMVGRDVRMELPRSPSSPGRIVFSVENLVCRGEAGLPAVRGVSLNVRAGEIVGIAGVSGNGQTELSLGLSGLLPISSGRVMLNGEDITGLDPARINARRFSHIPEDRHKHGIVMPLSLSENTILQRYDQKPFATRGMLNRRAIGEQTRDLIKRFRVKCRDEDQPIGALSGGNQQKLVVARELARNPDFILVNQLARGIDIGAMEFVMEEMLKQRDNGRAILLISTELEELFAICDRILVMFHGEILGELPPDRSRLDELGLLMAGNKEQPALAG